MDWNRYAYVLYNPIRYNDPTGHWIGDEYDPAGAETAEELADYYRININGIRNKLPEHIPTRDENLFGAYIRLFNARSEISYGQDGMYTTSGEELALILGSKEVNIAYDYDGLCEGNETCMHYATNTILVNPDRINNPKTALAASFAHEMVHYTTWRGERSRYEEANAFWVQKNVHSELINNTYPLTSQFDNGWKPTTHFLPEHINYFL